MHNSAQKQTQTSSVIVMDHNTLVNLFEAQRDFIAEVSGARPVQKLLDTSEISQFLQVTPQTVKKLRDEGMPHIRVGEVFRFDLDDVRAWLKSRGKDGGK